MAVVEHVTNHEISLEGKFERQKNHFTTPFGKEESKLHAEAGRYRLLWAPVCPWANRSLIVRSLLGLEDVISVGTLDPIRPDVPWSDWSFTLDPDGIDPVLKIHLLSEAYKKADPNYTGRFTVPALVDLTTGAVVNNDYFNLTLYFETEWTEFHKKNAPILYDLKSAFIYFALAIALYYVQKSIHIESTVWTLVVNTCLLLVFFAFICWKEKDLVNGVVSFAKRKISKS